MEQSLHVLFPYVHRAAFTKPAIHVHVHRAGLDDLYASAQKSLDAEQKMRQQLEQELEMQKSVIEEKDVRDYVI